MDPTMARLFPIYHSEPAGDGGDPGAGGGGGEGAAGEKGGGGEGGAPAGGAPTTYSIEDVRAMSPLELLQTPELRDDPTIRNTKSVDSLAQQLIAAQKMVGNPNAYLKRLSPDASPEERQAFFRELGAPEKPDEYVLPEDVERPEGMPEMSEKRLGEFRELFQQLGLTREQGQELLKAYSGMEASVWQQTAEQAQQKFESAQQQLKEDWGQAYDEKLQEAQQVANAKGAEFKEWLESKGLDNDPMMIRMLAELGGNLRDPNPADGPAGRRTGGVLTPDAAQQEIEELKGNQEFMKVYLADAQTPGHQAAVERMQRLFQTAYPSKERSR